MTTANPFFELGYPMDSVAHPLLPWWRQRVLAQKQGSRVVEATFTFERWDGMSVGQKTWTWTHDETPEALLARRRDVLASLLELDQAVDDSGPGMSGQPVASGDGVGRKRDGDRDPDRRPIRGIDDAQQPIPPSDRVQRGLRPGRR